jgi:hypothetical protein
MALIRLGSIRPRVGSRAEKGMIADLSMGMAMPNGFASGDFSRLTDLGVFPEPFQIKDEPESCRNSAKTHIFVIGQNAATSLGDCGHIYILSQSAEPDSRCIIFGLLSTNMLKPLFGKHIQSYDSTHRLRCFHSFATPHSSFSLQNSLCHT